MPRSTDAAAPTPPDASISAALKAVDPRAYVRFDPNGDMTVVTVLAPQQVLAVFRSLGQDVELVGAGDESRRRDRCGSCA